MLVTNCAKVILISAIAAKWPAVVAVSPIELFTVGAFSVSALRARATPLCLTAKAAHMVTGQTLVDWTILFCMVDAAAAEMVTAVAATIALCHQLPTRNTDAVVGVCQNLFH